MSAWAKSRMIGLLAKKFGDRASQPSSVSNQSANGSTGCKTNAISECVRRFSAAGERTWAFIDTSRWCFVNHATAMVYEMLKTLKASLTKNNMNVLDKRSLGSG